MANIGMDKVRGHLEKIVGSEQVTSGDCGCSFHSPLAVSYRHSPPCLTVRPGTTEQVQKIVKLANKKGLSIVPRSSTTCVSRLSVPAGNWIMIDMSRMDSIIHVDQRNRAVRFEPGVRWDCLQDELARHGFRAAIPLLPHPDKSALTSIVEREPSTIPKFEYAEPILTMEVVLPDGRVFRTGSAAGPASLKRTKASLVGPHGPSVMDFFRLFQAAQGSLGIVTWVNVKIESLPSPQKLFFIPCRELDHAVAACYRIQRKMIGYECFALDKCSLSNIISPDRGTQQDLPSWTVVLGLGGGPRLPKKKLAYEEHALGELISELDLELREQMCGLDSSFAKKLLRPWDREVYYKHARGGSSLDIFFITTMNKAQPIWEAFSVLCEKHQVDSDEIGRYLQPLEYGRSCHLEFSVPFSPQSPAQAKKVRGLARESVGLIMKHGGFFSRPYGIWNEAIRERGRSHNEAVGKLRKIMDPKGVMNPGAIL